MGMGEAMVYRADISDLRGVVRLALALWPDNRETDLLAEFAELLESAEAAVFLLEADGQAAGFAQVQTRHDYVEGTMGSPVGYLEGVYVSEDLRGQGYAGELLNACEIWAREKGCAEFASDCELGNADSLAWHLRKGFREANRIICFVKRL